jgi:hypothetical protein
MASEATEHKYREEGRIFAMQARRDYTDRSALEALCLHAESRTGVLRSSSVRLYWQQYRAAALEIAGETLPGAQSLPSLQRIKAALNKLRGKPAVPRTPSRKIKNPADWMVKAVFGHLKSMALRHRGFDRPHVRSDVCWRRGSVHGRSS